MRRVGTLQHRNPEPVAQWNRPGHIPRGSGLGAAQALLVALVVAGYPIVASTVVAHQADTQTPAIVFRAVVLFLALGVLGVSIVWHRSVHKGPILWVLAFYWTAILMRLLWDAYGADTTLYMPRDQLLALAVGATLVPMLACFVCVDTKGLSRAFGATVLITAVACVYSTVTNLLLVDVVREGRLQSDRLNTISYGHLGATLVVLSAYALATQKRLVFWPAVTTAVGLLVVSLAASRGPIIALAAALGVLVVGSASRVGVIAKRSLVVMAIAGIGILLASKVEQHSSYRPLSRLAGIRDDENSTLDRVHMIEGAWYQFAESPLWGGSLVEARSGFHPHNSVAESFMAGGVGVGLAFLWMSFVALSRCVRALRAGAPSGWMGVLFVQYFTGSLFSGTVLGQSTMWCLMAAIVANSPRPSSRVGDLVARNPARKEAL